MGRFTRAKDEGEVVKKDQIKNLCDEITRGWEEWVDGPKETAIPNFDEKGKKLKDLYYGFS
jgi:hypothetical protein